MIDKYKRWIEIGLALQDRDGMRYKVVSITEDGQEMQLREIRDDEDHFYNCTKEAARNMWIIKHP